MAPPPATRIVAALVALVLAAGCAGSNDDPAAEPTATAPAGPQTTTQATLAPAPVELGDGDPRAAWEERYHQGDAALGADPDVASATARAEAALERARQAGFDARGTVYPSGAVEIHLRFRSEADYFAPPRSDWLSLVFAGVGITRPGVLLVVEAPDGSPTFTAGRGVCYSDCSMPPASPGTPLADAARSRTRLRVAVRDADGSRLTVEADVCGPADGTAAALCDAFEPDRFGLVPPQVSDTSCSGAPSPTVDVRGEIDGVAVDTSYGNCTGGTAMRWFRLLTAAGVMPPNR